MTTSYHSYPKIFALGHNAIKDLLLDDVTVEEKIDGCVTLETPILCADLVYRQAGDLRVGQKLVAFTDVPVGSRLVESVVTHNRPLVKSCVRVITDQGTLDATEDHPVLVRNVTAHRTSKRWVKCSDLRRGDEIVYIGVWSSPQTWEAGYVAGQYDGEGTLVRSGNGRHLRYYQKVGPELNKVRKLVEEHGLQTRLLIRQRQKHHKPCGTLTVAGAWPEQLKTLGVFQPQRLLAKAKEKLWGGARLNYVGKAVVRRVSALGTKTIAGLSTSTKTYIAKGFLSHNSQFSFGVFPQSTEVDCQDGKGHVLAEDPSVRQVRCRSKGAQLTIEAPPSLFKKAVDTVLRLKDSLQLGWTYRGEVLDRPKHNVLAYARAPIGNIILFDINPSEERYLTYEEKKAEADRLGLEVVPLLFRGKVTDIELFRSFLERVSVLGAQPIEGVVVKNYARYGIDGKVLMGKFVSEAFKEVHGGEWKENNPKSGDILTRLVHKYRTPARWQKAVQHLSDDGKLEHAPKDIGKLIPATGEDIKAECEHEIKQFLFDWAWPHIQRGVIAGLAEWYKSLLLERQFDHPTQECPSPSCAKHNIILSHEEEQSHTAEGGIDG